MKHFHRLAQGIMVAPIMDAIMRHPQLWNAISEPQQIILRASPEYKDTEAARILSGIKKVSLDAMAMFGASQLGALMVQKVEPGKRAVFKAAAKGDMFAQYRFVLHTGIPNVDPPFLCGNEAVNMDPGELWWIDSSVPSAINNLTTDDIVHVIFHLRHDT